jgi:glutamine amidotransferase
MRVAIIDYGAGNIQSVANALERLKVSTICTADHDIIQTADKVIFPGVGQAAAAMDALKSNGLSDLIPVLKQPVLGICLGMQLLCEASDEGDVRALGIFPGTVKRFENTTKIPHMGWNKLTSKGIQISDSFGTFHSQQENWAYFIHSYYLPVGAHTTVVTDYGFPFSAVIEKDNFIGCQFHPEKSGSFGKKFLQKFIQL